MHRNGWIIEEPDQPSLAQNRTIAFLDLDLNKVSSVEKYVTIRYGNKGTDSYKVSVKLFSGQSALADAKQKLLQSKLLRQPLSGKILKCSKFSSDVNPTRFGIPQDLLPYYVSFLCEAIAIGLSMPLLPYFVMELGATAFHLSIVVSLTYFAQMIGCLVMGRVSDLYGRRTVMLLYLVASTLSYLNMARASSVTQVILARIMAGSFGGLLPVMQSAVGMNAFILSFFSTEFSTNNEYFLQPMFRTKEIDPSILVVSPRRSASDLCWVHC